MQLRSLPRERLAIFVVSTTGEGEVPDAMRPFWTFLLRRDLPAGALGSLRYATFGLGDSGYPKFNYAAKRLHRRLAQLGATPLLPCGLGDDQVRPTRCHILFTPSSPTAGRLYPSRHTPSGRAFLYHHPL